MTNKTQGFSSDQYALAYPDSIETHWWHMARNRIIANTIRTFTGSEATVLDVGCGRGIAVQYLRDQGINCVGIETAEEVKPLPSIADYIRVGIEARDLSSAEREQYDTLLLLDVIEHIPEPLPFLQHITTSFPNLTHLILTVPARQELWSNYDDFYGHYRRYTIKMLKSISSALRVTNTWESYFFHLAYPIGLAAAFAKRQIKPYTPKSQLSQWIHKFISFAMLCDYFFLPRYVPGMSIIACFSLDRSSDRKDRSQSREQ